MHLMESFLPRYSVHVVENEYEHEMLAEGSESDCSPVRVTNETSANSSITQLIITETLSPQSPI